MNVSLFLSILTEILILVTGTESSPSWRWRSNSKYHSWHRHRGETGDGCYSGQCVQPWKCPKGALSTEPTGSCAYWYNGPWVCCTLTNDDGYKHPEDTHRLPTKSTNKVLDHWNQNSHSTSAENNWRDGQNSRHATTGLKNWGRNVKTTPVSSLGDLPINSWERPNLAGSWNKGTKVPSLDRGTTISDWDKWAASYPHNSRTTKHKITPGSRIIFPTESASWTRKTTKQPTATTIEWKRTTKVNSWRTTPKPSWSRTTKFPGRLTPKVAISPNTRRPTSSTKSTNSVWSGGERRNPAPVPPTSRFSTQSSPMPRSRNRFTTPLPNLNTYMCGIRDKRSQPSRGGRNYNPDADVVNIGSSNSRSREKFQRIVGGEEVDPFSWPWVAALYKVSSAGVNRFLSAGSLINENFVLTAAHPFTREDIKSSTYIVMLGTHNAQDAVADYIVTSVIQHPSYEQRYYYHDIALLRLEHPVIFNEYVMPVCLPSPDAPLLRDRDLEGKKVTVMGWGDDSYGGKSSRVLKEATFSIMSRRSCNASYVSVASNRFPRGITENMLCAGDPNGGKDACQGDSGGPLTSVERGRHTQVGIVSFGYQCGYKEFPGVYTKVAPYLSWIAENTEHVHHDYHHHYDDYDDY